ncbi:MAG TPA: DUF1553 domain-containing protein [Pontiellaceae bacterium]|nr:DUF1553 domain-containing protein [Pontiellaceae bacterium]HPR83582.1 DUF1553 domain-containing protein [Pontiellaceae bacterium]
MMKRGLFFGAALCVIVSTAAAKEPAAVLEQSSTPEPAGRIDQLVFSRLEKIKIQPALCSDEVFVRRVYLDVIGKLPSAKEVVAFLDKPDAETRRSELIDELLARDEFADYWAMKWSDVLRIKAEFPINLWPNAAQAYHRWVRTSIAENKPYDRFVREMLTASGSNFRVGPVNFYRAMQSKTPRGIAATTALTFMGVRAESWPENRLDSMALFFSQVGYKATSEWKEEFVFWDPLGTAADKANSAPGKDLITTANTGAVAQVSATPCGPVETAFPDGKKILIPPDRDPREVFADWLITPENPWFSRCIVNRVWAWLLGRGIIHEPDDIRDDNPPSNPELLAWLEKEFSAHQYDLKYLYRLILNSKTYQLSSVSKSSDPSAAAQFASYPLRRLEAEVLIDAINSITGSSDLYTSAIPEPFTYIPKDQSAVSIADGSITSPFLALFGRSARATGMWNERDNEATPSQRLHLLNSGQIQEKLEKGPKLKALISAKKPPEEIIEDLYLTILSRRPTKEEKQIVFAYGNLGTPENPPPPGKPGKTGNEKQKQQRKPGDPGRQSSWIDIAWALINSPEFLYRH